MEPIRVTMVVKLYPPWGGLERHVALLSESIAASREDVRVTVVTAHQSPARASFEERRGISVHRATTLGRFQRTPISLGLPALLRRTRPDILHYHSSHPWAELLAPVRSRIPIAVTYYHDVVRQKLLLPFYRPVIRRLLRRADRIVAWTPELIQSSPLLREFASKVTVSAGGIETTRFTPTPESKAAARRMRARLAPDGPLTLFVGRLVYYKGIDYLLRAMTEVPGTLALAGIGDDYPQLAALTRDLGLLDRVHFLMNVSDDELPALYQASDVLVLPSVAPTETFGLVQVEAHVSGTPTICTSLPTGVTRVTQHEVTGLVVPPADAAALAASLRRLLSDAPLRQQLGEEAQRRALREFSITRCAADMVTIYRAMLQRDDTFGSGGLNVRNIRCLEADRHEAHRHEERWADNPRRHPETRV